MSQLLERPHPKAAKSAFFDKIISHWLIAGTNYLYGAWPDTSTILTSTPPPGLYVLPPYYVTPQTDTETGELTAYRYDYGRGYVDYPLWKILSLTSFHPLDELNGFSPLFAASMAVDRMNEGEKWNISLMQHAARPSGAFISDGNMADPDFDLLKQEIQDKYTGANRAGIPMLLEGGLKYVQMGLSPLQIDWLNGDKDAGRKISMAIGVDPLLLNDKEHSTYNNVEQARIALVDQTALPILIRMCEYLNGWLMPYYGDDGILGVDMKYINMLRQDASATSIMTIGEYNAGVRGFVSSQAMLNIETPASIPEFYRMGINIYVMEKDLPDYLQKQADQRNNPPPLAGGQLPLLPQNKPPVGVQKITEVGKTPNKLTSTKSWDVLAPIDTVDTFRDDLQGYFVQEKASVLDSLYGCRTHDEVLTRVTETRHSLIERLPEVYLAHYATIADAAAKALQEQFLVTSPRPITIFRKDALLAVTQNAAHHIAAIDALCHDALETAIISSPLSAMRDTLTFVYDVTFPEYIDLCIESERIAAKNLGAWIASMQVDVPLTKQWNATHPRHAHLDTRINPLDAPFDVMGQFPGDAVEQTNELCTCTLSYKYNHVHDRHGRFAGGSGIPGVSTAFDLHLSEHERGQIAHRNGVDKPVMKPKKPGTGVHAGLREGQQLLFPMSELEAMKKPKRVKVPRARTSVELVASKSNDTLPLGALMTAKLKPFDAGYEGDNPRFTTVVDGKKYFVKRLEGNKTGTESDAQTAAELAQRAGAKTIGLSHQTIEGAVFTRKDGSDYFTQAFATGYKSGVQGGDINEAVEHGSSPILTRMVLHEYLAGTADRHEGQYMVNPDVKGDKHMLMIDFGLGFPYSDGMGRKSELMYTMSSQGTSIDIKALQDVAKHGEDYLKATSNFLNSEQSEYLRQRVEILQEVAKEAAQLKKLRPDATFDVDQLLAAISHHAMGGSGDY